MAELKVSIIHPVSLKTPLSGLEIISFLSGKLGKFKVETAATSHGLPGLKVSFPFKFEDDYFICNIFGGNDDQCVILPYGLYEVISIQYETSSLKTLRKHMRHELTSVETFDGSFSEALFAEFRDHPIVRGIEKFFRTTTPAEPAEVKEPQTETINMRRIMKEQGNLGTKIVPEKELATILDGALTHEMRALYVARHLTTF